METFKDWCIEQHRSTNHFYDTYLPYEFHLRMVHQVYEDFKHLLPLQLRVFVKESTWGHDLLEDTRVSYNDIKAHSCQEVADIIYALTNEKGRNRAERANDAYYTGIRNTPGAVFTKLCDRIANVQYSKMTRSRMFEMYQKENEDFMTRVGAEKYPEMKDYLTSLSK